MKDTLKTVAIAENWTEWCNKKNIDELKAITEEEFEVSGPKGTAVLDTEGIKDWLNRAGIRLETFEIYADNNKIILSQHAEWLEQDGSVKGSQDVYTFLTIINDKVKSLARFDDKEDAFEASGLTEDKKLR